MNKQGINIPCGLRTGAGYEEPLINKRCFELHPGAWENQIVNFQKCVRRQNMSLYLTLYEIMKRVVSKVRILSVVSTRALA